MDNSLRMGLLVAALGAAACGDDGSGPPPGPADTVAPRVVSLSPGLGENGVRQDVVVTVVFSERVNPATVAQASFFLTTQFVSVAGTYAVADSVANFIPSTPLESLTVYTATLTRGIRDPAGNQLVADTSWSFATGAPPPPAAPAHGPLPVR